MRLGRMAALAALSSSVFLSSGAAARSCWYPVEAEAAQVRALHLMLMVGTLQCRKSHPASVGLYNEFVEKQRPLLVSNVGVLKDHFVRESGAGRWQQDYDRFETSLANLYSARLDDGGFCDTVQRIGRSAAQASGADLLALSESVAEAPTIGLCSLEGEVFDDPAEAQQLPPKVVIADALSAPASPDRVIAAKAGAAEVADVDDEVIVADAAESEEPVMLAAAAEEASADSQELEPASQAEDAPAEMAAASAPASREEALQAAVAALQSAAAALQAASLPRAEGKQ